MMKFRPYTKRADATKKGFSLVEMMVALAIFSLVAVVAIGAYLSIVDANKKAQSLKTAINNLNFTLESISREVRVSTALVCGEITEFPGGGERMEAEECEEELSTYAIAFHSSRYDICGDDEAYSLVTAYRYNEENQSLEKAEQQDCNDTLIAESTWVPVTSPDLRITNMQFFVTDLGPISELRINVAGESGTKEKYITTFGLQTTVAQRLSY